MKLVKPGILNLQAKMKVGNDKQVLEIPQDLTNELEKDPKAKLAFYKLAYSHKREYVQWIEEAKKPETRIARIKKTVEKVKEKSPEY